jgi:hypothetical protein
MRQPSHGEPQDTPILEVISMRQGNPILMRRRLALAGGAAALLSTFALAAAPAAANVTPYYSAIQTWVYVYHGTKEVSGVYARTGTGPVPTSIGITLNNRDYGRFTRWCGSTGKIVAIPDGFYTKTVACGGSSTWKIEVRVDLLSLVGTAPYPFWTNDTGSDIPITVNVSK